MSRDATSRRLGVEPRLASWDAAASPTQVALARYLDHIEDLARTFPPPAPSALHLIVDHAQTTSSEDVGHDLDNYLYPVVRRLGADRFVLVRASKTPEGPSRLVVGHAIVQARVAEGPGWRFAQASTTRSADSRDWKQEVHDQLAAAPAALSAGEQVAVEIAFRVGPHRNWTNLWKPAIDSLGPIVGEGHRPFAPRDDLNAELGLHLEVDASLGNQVELGVWWRPVGP